MADTEEVTTTRRTPSSLAAVSTLIVPLIAGANSSFFEQPRKGKDQNQVTPNHTW